MQHPLIFPPYLRIETANLSLPENVEETQQHERKFEEPTHHTKSDLTLPLFLPLHRIL